MPLATDLANRTGKHYFAPKSTDVGGSTEALISEKVGNRQVLLTASASLTGNQNVPHPPMAGPFPTMPAPAFGSSSLIVVAYPGDNHVEFRQAALALFGTEIDTGLHHNVPVVDPAGIVLLPGYGETESQILTRDQGAWRWGNYTTSSAAANAFGARLCTPGQLVVDAGTQLTALKGMTSANPGGGTSTALSSADPPAWPPVVLRDASSVAHILTFRTAGGNSVVYHFTWNGSALVPGTAPGSLQVNGYVISGPAAIAVQVGGVTPRFVLPTNRGVLLSAPVAFTSTTTFAFTGVAGDNVTLGGVVTTHLRRADGLYAIVGDSAGTVNAVRVSDGAVLAGYGWPIRISGTAPRIVESPAVITLGTARWLVVSWEDGNDGFINVYELSPAAEAAPEVEWPEFQRDGTNSGCVALPTVN
ncbi:MAG: hypothetical protein HY904_11680 [Deltaproteobacteria bacterium]|nr:hypothetical protein [Deltaproteobacteria bacterium]